MVLGRGREEEEDTREEEDLSGKRKRIEREIEDIRGDAQQGDRGYVVHKVRCSFSFLQEHREKSE